MLCCLASEHNWLGAKHPTAEAEVPSWASLDDECETEGCALQALQREGPVVFEFLCQNIANTDLERDVKPCTLGIGFSRHHGF